MSAPLLPGLLSDAPKPLSPTPAAGEDRARVRELAHQFEAIFIGQMLRQMRQSLTMAGDEGDEGGSKPFAAMTDTVDTELARALSEAGGIGIAGVIIDAFEQKQAAAAAAMPTGGASLRPLVAADTAPRSLAPAAPNSEIDQVHSGVIRPASAGAEALAPQLSETLALPLPIGHKVTSRFGWRADPFTGETRFHKGVDVRAAYGQRVPVVADGTVVSAGPSHGYGVTVLVEHGSGIRTRYAHLSETGVKVGDVVKRGQEIGRVGQTGRSTGPHLHFELLDAGRPVDPLQTADRFRILGQLKEVRAVADSPNGWPSTRTAGEE
jgi:murein DD-endopeptidase MepM/ murein hydrolase activator NlpD